MIKRLFFSCLMISAGSLVVSNCTKAPVYPDTPQIEFQSITQKGDSIFIEIRFQDGDGDLGLGQQTKDYLPPYHEFVYVKDNNGNYIEKGSRSGMPPFNCKNYKTGSYDADLAEDTVLIETNFNSNNYFLDFYIRQDDGSYLKYDFSNFCPDFNQRFPVLNSLEENGPIEGTLSYKTDLSDIRFSDEAYMAMSNRFIKFRIYIQDRKFNKSNVIETSEIFFGD